MFTFHGRKIIAEAADKPDDEYLDNDFVKMIAHDSTPTPFDHHETNSHYLSRIQIFDPAAMNRSFFFHFLKTFGHWFVNSISKCGPVGPVRSRHTEIYLGHIIDSPSLKLCFFEMCIGV